MLNCVDYLNLLTFYGTHQKLLHQTHNRPAEIREISAFDINPSSTHALTSQALVRSVGATTKRAGLSYLSILGVKRPVSHNIRPALYRMAHHLSTLTREESNLPPARPGFVVLILVLFVCIFFCCWVGKERINSSHACRQASLFDKHFRSVFFLTISFFVCLSP